MDWWTLGILAYEMMVGQPPFIDDDPMGIYQQVIKTPSIHPKLLRSLARRVVIVLRPSFFLLQILQGNLTFPRWIDRNAKSLIKKLLVADITKRYGCLKDGAEDIKNHKWFGGFDFNELLERRMVAPIVPQVKEWFAVMCLPM